MNGKVLNGSICLTELVAQCKKGHSAFSKADNGKLYFNVALWLNDEPDKYGNHMSIQLSSKKESKDKDGKVYIGNAKFSDKAGGAPIKPSDTKELDLDDMPF